MPAFSDYSANPSEIDTIAGLASAEGATSLASLNNMLREVFAQGRQLRDMVDGLTGGMPKTGGEFTGTISRKEFGGYYFAQDATHVAPRIYVLPEGAPAPTAPPAGSLLIYHAA